MSETAAQIVDREIRASTEPRLASIKEMRKQAKRLVKEADEAEKALIKQLRCNAAQAHEFVGDPYSGMLGDRFEEKCKHCGWIHTC